MHTIEKADNPTEKLAKGLRHFSKKNIHTARNTRRGSALIVIREMQ